LNLHENRTKKQYLTENIFSDLFKTLGTGIITTGWEKFPCVVQSKNVKPILRKDNTVMYDGSGFLWFGNGRRMNKTTKEMSTYYCGTDGKIQITPVTSGTNIIGMGKVINSVKPQIPEVLKLAGLSGTDLSQENINKLYDILSKK
jgi:hypothetical protein